MRSKTFKIIVPIHDAIMIECEDEEIAQNVGQLMKDTANQLFNGEFACDSGRNRRRRP